MSLTFVSPPFSPSLLSSLVLQIQTILIQIWIRLFTLIGILILIFTFIQIQIRLFDADSDPYCSKEVQ